MPHLKFTCPQEQRLAGCLQAFMMYIPFDPRQQVPTQQGPMSGAQVAWNLAMQDCMSKSIPIPPQCSFQPEIISVNKDKGDQPFIYMVEISQPTVDRTQVNAVDGTPIANGYKLSEPPIMQAKRTVPQGAYEPLDDSALAMNSDPMMGDMDGLGGTWTDFSPTERVEKVRQIYMEPSKPVAGGGR